MQRKRHCRCGAIEQQEDCRYPEEHRLYGAGRPAASRLSRGMKNRLSLAGALMTGAGIEAIHSTEPTQEHIFIELRGRGLDGYGVRAGRILIWGCSMVQAAAVCGGPAPRSTKKPPPGGDGFFW